MVRQLLDLIGDVAEELRLEGIDVPSVVVCGNQSSGKSSLLESLTGVQFPRGDGTVTRCPIVVRTKTDRGAKWKGMVKGGRTVDNPAALCEEIARCQPKKGDGIIEQAIEVEITQSHGPELRLVDLPGIVQESGLHEKTVRLVEEYIKNPLAVILVVTPATDDLETSRAIQLARSADPSGERTLGVLTKMDYLRDDLTRKKTVVNILTNNAATNFELKLGYVAVRTRKGDEAHMPLEEVAEREIEFFQSDELLSTLDRRYLGIDTLKMKVARVQTLFLRRFKERLERDIKNRIEKLEDELSQLEEVPNRNCKAAWFGEFMDAVAERFRSQAKSREYIDNVTKLGGDFDKLGMRFCEKLYDRLIPSADRILEDPGRLKELKVDIENLGSYSRWTCLNVFTEYVQKHLVGPLKEEAEGFVDQVTQLVRKTVKEVVSTTEKHKVDRFPRFREKLQDMLQEDISKYDREVRRHIRKILDAEACGARFSATSRESADDATLYFSKIIRGLDVDKQAILMSALKAGPGGWNSAFAALFQALSPPNSEAADSCVTFDVDNETEGIIEELKKRANQFACHYGNSLPRLAWTEQVSGLEKAFGELKSKVTSEENLPDEIMEDDPELGKRQSALGSRLRKLRLAHEGLHNISFEPEPSP